MELKKPKGLRYRKSFARIPKIIDIPNLIMIQKESYDKFLYKGNSEEIRKASGLSGIFHSVFPIYDFNKTASLEYFDYSLDEPKYDVEECRQRGMTYAAPMKVFARLVTWDINEDTGVKSIRAVKEQEVYFGEIPLMTQNGTFIINGTERVVVSQLHRSPGVFFEHDKGTTHASGKFIYSARIIPYRGSWVDFEFDHKDILYVRIDRRRKMPATILLRALGLSTQEILAKFYKAETVYLKDHNKMAKSLDYDMMLDQRVSYGIYDPKTGEEIVKKNSKVTRQVAKKLRLLGVTEAPIEIHDLDGKILADDIVDEETGEILFECNEEVTKETIKALREKKIKGFSILYIDNTSVGPFLRNTLLQDKISTPDEAVLEIYRRLRPGEPSTVIQARNYFQNLFFNPARYDLSRVGRLKMNYKFNIYAPLSETTLKQDDFIAVVGYLLDLKIGKSSAKVDDIDHLGNRRIRAVGELMENQYRIGLVRMEKGIKEKMNMSPDIDTLMPHDLINAKPVSAVIKEYFGSSQLSQFMDQTNPLSEITHKRRLSALGPGGLTRDRAGFEVRDVHTTHYGRICPIETPEGPNIGLIASLSSYARVNEYGFIETPYRKVEDGKVTNTVVYLSALQEENHSIAQANAELDSNDMLLDEMISVRKSGEFMMVRREEVSLMDVSPSQLVSVAASLIPFLEHDDANRALMGSNMQRQAVPLIKTTAPLVGTDMEWVVASDSGVTVVARRDGVVESVDANRIIIRPFIDEENLVAKPEIYNLIKYQRSNQNTCINQKPIVKKGQVVQKGQVIADGPATEQGELALGHNVTVALIPWGGYNFEDSILLSERLVREDYFTSIHIEEFECVARDTKLGREEITRDIPNVAEDALKDLDATGIVRIGAEVRPGDILVGKITPKGETQLSPEEKLLRAIFGEKAGDVKDSSLRAPTGVYGIVLGAKVFSRKGVDKDERTKDIEEIEEQRLQKDMMDEIKIIEESIYSRIANLLKNRKSGVRLQDHSGKVLIKKGDKFEPEAIHKVPRDLLKQIRAADDEDANENLVKLIENMEDQIHAIQVVFNEKIKKLKKGDELPPGVIKMVKIYVATKRKIQVGDKMAGRHGNKGVISRILPIEDMPYLSNGQPIDIVLNPLGVPSRMNVGQILEMHLGAAARKLGEDIQKFMDSKYSVKALRDEMKRIFGKDEIKKLVDDMPEDELVSFARQFDEGLYFASPVFDGSKESEIKDLLKKAELSTNGKAVVFDGRTGEAFDADLTVGVMYIMKLHHLVDEKIHARSTGPYSLVTQQPLGGKAQFGGQRLGEMEVWALEAYGAAYGLQEFLTVKSDDVSGRTATYEAIVKGDHNIYAGLPESFNVLVKELKALAIDVELLEEDSVKE